MISVILMGITICALLLVNRELLKIDKRVIVSYIFICLLLVFSMLLNGLEVAGDRFLYYITFGTSAVLAINSRFDIVRVFHYLIYLYIIQLIVYLLFQRSAMLSSEEYGTLQIGLVYSLLPGLNIAFACILFHDEFLSGKKLLFGLSIVAFVGCLFVVLFDCYSRGGLLSTIICMMLLSWKKMGKFFKFFFICAIGSFIALFLTNSDTLLISALDNFSGSSIRSLSKLSWMYEKGDVTNGRNDLYVAAVKLIKDNPALGYGVGYFEKINGLSYPHQFFLEIMCEFGVLGLFIFFLPILKSFVLAFKEKSIILSQFRMVLLVSSFFPLMFSSSLWLFPLFWVAYFYSIKNTKINLALKGA